MTMTNTMMYEEDDDYYGNYASRPPKSVRMTSDSSSIASSVTGTTTIMSRAQQQIVPLPPPPPPPLPRAHNSNSNNDGVLRLTEGFIDDLCLGIEHDLLGKTEDVEILLQLFPSLFDDDDTSSYGQTNTILYECYSTKQHTNKSNDSDSETELDDISDWSSVVTTSPSNNDEGDDDDDDDNPGITLEEEEEEKDKNSRALFIAIQTSQDGIEIHENNKSNEDSKPVIKLGDVEDNIDTYYNLELTVQTSESEDRIEVQSAFDDDDDDNDDDNDEMKENNNKKEMYEKEYCCDNNEKEDMERNCSTFTHDDALISLEVPDDELFVLDIASNIDDNDNDDNCTNEKREETKKDTRRKKPDPPSIVSNDGNGNHQRNSNNDPPAITDMHNDPINVGSVFSSAIANLITTSTKTSSSTTLNNEQNESSESMLTDEVTMLTNTNEEEQSSILTDELITLVNKNINSNNNNIELLTTTVANDCEREKKEEVMTFNNNDDPPSPLWLGDDTATILSEDTTVVSAVTGQHCNDDDNQEYDDDEDSESFQLSVILNETIPKDAVNASNDQWTDESITNTEENVIHTTPSGVRIDNYDCIPTRSSFFQSYDDEPNKKKNDDTDTIEIDLNVKKIMSPGDHDNNTVEGLATTSEAKIRSINGAIVACATLDLANNKFVINDDCNSFSGDVGVESKTTSANDVAILRQPSFLREEESDALKDVNQAFLSSFDKRNSEIHYSTEAVYYGTMDELSCDSTITTRATDRKAESSGINRVIISVGMNESDAKVKRSRFLKRIKKRLFKLSSRGGRSSSNNNNDNNIDRGRGRNNSKSCWHEHEDSVTGKHYYSNGKISTWKRPAKELILAY